MGQYMVNSIEIAEAVTLALNEVEGDFHADTLALGLDKVKAEYPFTLDRGPDWQPEPTESRRYG